ncbi:MAG: DNA polymerase IV, partial [Bacteroidota bacterium]|nr:DNA polymerase IV [Bacteroidota bacterium]
MEDKRSILHFDLDTFFVSVERLINSSLNNKPVVIGGNSDRAVVASCSYEARQFGVHSGMPMRMARNLCPDAFAVRGDLDLYNKYSKLVTEIISEKAPLYEKASIDEHYIDISGMDKFFGNLKWAKELRSSIIENTGLPISFGLSVNKTVAKIATGEAKPNGELQINNNFVKAFLNPLSIRKIPMIGKKTYFLLRSMGIVKIHTLSNMPPEMVKTVLGKNGISIWKKANGLDTSVVKSYSERKSISSEKTFEKDTTDIIELNKILNAMVEKTAFKLRKKHKLTGCVTVKIRYSNFDTHTLQKNISYTSFDHKLQIIVKALFQKLYSRRMRIRLIGIKFSKLVYGGQQLNLFDDKAQMIDLYYEMDK